MRAWEPPTAATQHANPSAERAVLGSVLVDDSCLEQVARRIEPGDFADPRHRKIFAGIRAVADSGRAVDLVTVAAELGSDADPVYLAGLLDGIPDVANVAHYADFVKEHANTRALIEACHETLALAETGRADFSSLSRGLADRCFALGDAAGDFDLAFRSQAPYGDLLLDRVEKLASGETFSIKTGVDRIDGLIHGYEPGTINLICGETSNGKTDLALAMLLRMAGLGTHAGFVSIDMPAVQLETRLVRPIAGMRFHDVQNAGSNPPLLGRVVAALTALRALPIYLCDASHVSIGEMERVVRAFRRSNRLDVVFVDYIQLVDAKGQTREREVSMVSRGLKRIARTEKIPVVALAQLSRTSGDNHRPALHRLRDSGQLEQDAATVIGVYKPDRPENGDEDPAQDTIEISILKQQNGACETWREPMEWAIGRLGGGPSAYSRSAPSDGPEW